MFEDVVIEKLEAYVYALIDPRNNSPFYIGKGRGNRVFTHAAGKLESAGSSEKYDTIMEILKENKQVNHLILRHGMTDQTALDVEAALIDFCTVINQPITNIVSGYKTIAFGVMTTDEIIRKYQTDPLLNIEEGFILFNINQTYKRAKGEKSYYEATKELWRIKNPRDQGLKYALSEYKGFIVEVFKISEWYSIEIIDKNNKKRERWGFNGTVAEPDVRNQYLNKSIQKRQGMANPIRYNYQSKA